MTSVKWWPFCLGLNGFITTVSFPSVNCYATVMSQDDPGSKPSTETLSLFCRCYATTMYWKHLNGLVQDWGNSKANALQLPQSCVNSLRPSDAIWQHISGSTLAQVMAWCSQAPSHYLNQCWLIISKVLWPPYTKISLKITYIKLNWNLPGPMS